jgi:hypothetical protein
MFNCLSNTFILLGLLVILAISLSFPTVSYARCYTATFKFDISNLQAMSGNIDSYIKLRATSIPGKIISEFDVPLKQIAKQSVSFCNSYHDDKSTDALITIYFKGSPTPIIKKSTCTVSFKEKDYDCPWWWSICPPLKTIKITTSNKTGLLQNCHIENQQKTGDGGSFVISLS